MASGLPTGFGSAILSFDISVRYIEIHKPDDSGKGREPSSRSAHVLELAILGLLQEQPRHGYELKKRLSETLGSFWGISFGSLYPALRRLERSGAIEVVDGVISESAAVAPAMPATGSLKGEAAAARLRLVPAATGRRVRKAYRITPFGQEQFFTLLTADDGGDDERLFSLKLAFCRFLDAPARLVFLERRRTELNERLTRASGNRGPTLDRYTRSLMDHRTRSTERDLEWIDDLIATEQQSPEGGGPPSTPGAPEQEGATA
jgi:DNA-binding PadR family transcriptional regulator